MQFVGIDNASNASLFHHGTAGLISLVITLKFFDLGVGELRRETGEPVLVAVDYGLEGFILAVGLLII